MLTIESALRRERNKLEKIVEDAKIRLKAAPEGRLRIQRKRGSIEYYYKKDSRSREGTDADENTGGERIVKGNTGCERTVKENTGGERIVKGNTGGERIVKGNTGGERTVKGNIRDHKTGGCHNGRYLKKDEKNLAMEIAQRDYDIKVIKKAEERIKAIDAFIEKYQKTSLDSMYESINQCRRDLISSRIICDSEFIKQWQAVKYEGKLIVDETREIVTERGERVRSKSEKIIADKLYALGIPYRYEYPLVLEGNIKIYPDFTILRMPAREEVYLEHFGMMDEKDYVEGAIHKLNTYEKNGICIGVNLFITFETSKKALSTRALDRLIKKLFCEE